MAYKFTNVRDYNGTPVAPVEYDVYAGTDSIEVGNPVTDDGSNPGYVTNVATGATSIIGIAAGLSTQTASADGKVLIYQAPMLRFKAHAQTPGNLAQTVKTTQVTIDVTSTSFEVDENDTSSGFIRIEDYDDTTNGNCECIAQCTL